MRVVRSGDRLPVRARPRRWLCRCPRRAPSWRSCARSACTSASVARAVARPKSPIAVVRSSLRPVPPVGRRREHRARYPLGACGPRHATDRPASRRSCSRRKTAVPLEMHNQQGVVRDGTRRDDGKDRYLGALRQQRHEGLVFHLLEPAQREHRCLVPIPEERPDAREELPVPRVPPVDLDEERSAAGGDGPHRPHTSGSEPGGLDVLRFEPHVRERFCDLVGCGPPSG